jgi:hypothetical protein
MNRCVLYYDQYISLRKLARFSNSSMKLKMGGKNGIRNLHA